MPEDNHEQDDFHFGPAIPSDEEIIAEFNVAMAKETEERHLNPLTVLKGVRAIFDDERRGRYLVARTPEQVIGQLLITLEWSDWRNGDIWWIQSVYVHPSYRRRGVFRGLFEHLEGEVRTRDDVVGVRLYVETDNQIAKATYRQLGMSAGGYEVMELMKS